MAPKSPHKTENVITHGPPFRGVAMDPLGVALGPNDLQFALGAVTDRAGTALRSQPMPRPVGRGHSLYHPDPNLFDGLNVWAINPGRRGEMVIAVTQHGVVTGGRANPKTGEVIASIGANFGGRKFFHNHAPLAPRDSNYRFTGSTLRPASGVTLSQFSAAPPNSPPMVVIAADGNPAMCVLESESEPFIEIRQFGLNAPQTPLAPGSTTTPFGNQLPLKGGAITEFTSDPDIDWAIDLSVGKSLEAQLDNDDSVGPAQFASRIAVVIATATTPVGTVRIQGTSYNPDTQQVTENDSEDLTIGGVATPSVAGKYTPGVSWTGALITTKFWVAGEVGQALTAAFQSTGSGTIEKVLLFRVGTAINAHELPANRKAQQWRAAYAFGRKIGTYETRGGHNWLGANEGRFTVADDANIRCEGFGSPLSTDAPNRLYLMVQRYTDPSVLRRNNGEAAGEGAFAAFYLVREIPIRNDNGTWRTDFGFASHDVTLAQLVVDCPFNAQEVVEGDTPWPGGLVAAGGYKGCFRFAGAMWFYGREAYRFASVTSVAGSKIFTLGTGERAYGWMNGCKLVYGGKKYTIIRILNEGISGDAQVEAQTAATGSGTDKGYLDPEPHTLRWTVDDAQHGEVTPVTFVRGLPLNDTLYHAAVIADRAFLFGARRMYELVQSPDRFNVYRENVVAPETRIVPVSAQNGAVGPGAATVVDDAIALFTGLGVSMGSNPSAIQDVTRLANSRFFREWIDAQRAGEAQLGYSQLTHHVVLGSLVPQDAQFPDEADAGAILDGEAGLAFFPCHPVRIVSMGSARIAQGRIPWQRLRDGSIFFRVVVDSVDSADSNKLVASAGNYVVVYDTLAPAATAWKAFSLADFSLDHGIDAAEGASPSGEEAACFQGIDGKVRMEVGNNQYRVRLEFTHDGSEWQLSDSDAFTDFSGTRFWAAAALWDGSYVALGEASTGDFNDLCLYHFAAGDIGRPYIPGRGGSQTRLTQSGFEPNNIYRTILIGPSGEIILFGKSGTNLQILRYNPETFEPIGSVVSIPTGGDVPISFAANRDGWIFWVTVSVGGEVKCKRWRPATVDNDGDTTTLELEGESSITPPSGEAKPGILVDTRNQAFAFVPKNIVIAGGSGSGNGIVSGTVYNLKGDDDRWGPLVGRTLTVNGDDQVILAEELVDDGGGFFERHVTVADTSGFTGSPGLWSIDLECLGYDVFLFIEEDGSETSWEIYRGGYDRRCMSCVQAGNFFLHHVEDTPVGGGTVERRLVTSIGIATDAAGAFVGDGDMDTADPFGEAETYVDLTTRIAGANGVLSFCAIDNAFGSGRAWRDQANATEIICMRGPSEQ